MRNWLKLDGSYGEYHPKLGQSGQLTADNDQGKTFKQIADIIESEPEGLFVAD